MKNKKQKLIFVIIFAFFIVGFFCPAPTVNAASLVMPSSLCSIHSFDSQQLPGYPATAAIDGNAATFWTYKFDPVSARTPHPHYIALDLGNSYTVEGLRYLPRQDGSLYGTITRYEVYVSEDPTIWGTAVKTGTFASDSTLKEIAFTGKLGRYVKLVSLADAMNSVAVAVAEINVLVPAGTVLTSTQISINSFDSQQLPGYPATAAIDGNAATFWTYKFDPVSARTPHPHYIALDLGNSYTVEGLRYLPRQDGSLYGTITRYEVYVSENPQDWGTAIKIGTFASDSILKEIVFTGKLGRYVKLVSLADAMNSVAVAVAELNILVPEGTAFPASKNPPIEAPQTNISIHSFDSQQLPGYPATAAIDGNAATFWTYKFDPVSARTPHPHYIALDLGNSYTVEGLRYLPRQDGSLYGTITRYEVYVSENPQDWGTAIKIGTFASDSILKEIVFTGKLGRYVKLVSLADAMNSVAVAVAEIQAIGNNIPNKDISFNSLLGPDISVGLWSYTRDNLRSDSFHIEANKNYLIKNNSGNVLATVPAQTQTYVTYDSDQNIKVYGSIANVLTYKEVTFEAADGNNSGIIFNTHRPDSTYDQYRGKIKLKYNDTSREIWVINILPMEHYVWGMGETTGTGHINHTRVMTSMFRTYGYWYLKYATKYAPYGFKIKSDSGSQIYRGYEWETLYPNIKLAAETTRGMIASYGGDVALTPYSSWSDGRTRSFEERWGSKDYPWCKSVSDPYGKHPTMTTSQLEAAGNHMVGLIANGSVKLASTYGWDWQRILKYYYTGISIAPIY